MREAEQGWCGQPCPGLISCPRHPLHTPALISRCEPWLPCDRPFSGEGGGGVLSTSASFSPCSCFPAGLGRPNEMASFLTLSLDSKMSFSAA